jgi:hypothetical protein
MELPKYIKEAIEKAAIYQMRAKENNELVRNWLEKKGYTYDSEHDMGGVIDMLVEHIEMNCEPREFIAFLEDNFE